MNAFVKLLTLLATFFFMSPPASAQTRELVVTFGGDVNFARSRMTPQPDTVSKFVTYPLDYTTRNIEGIFDGHLNFINVETVVGTRDGSPLGKSFVFRTHPDQIRHMMGLGVNAFSLANNHSYDHGWSGLSSTLEFFRNEARGRDILFAGVETGAVAFAPQIKIFNNVSVAFAAIGIGSNVFAAGDSIERPGMATLFAPGHYDQVLAAMAAAQADIKILSIHYGTENQITLNAGQQAMFSRAVTEAGVNLVLGHHPHVPRAVEVGADHAIFYSLGNFLFLGGADRDNLPVGQDYGMFGKAYFTIDQTDTRLSAIEVLPLRNVEISPEPMTTNRASATLAHLSRLSRRSVGAPGLQISLIADGEFRGATCFGGKYGPLASSLCCQIEHRLECDLPDLM